MKKIIECFMYVVFTVYILITIGILYSIATGPHSEYFPMALVNCLAFNAICYIIAKWLFNRFNKKP